MQCLLALEYLSPNSSTHRCARGRRAWASRASMAMRAGVESRADASASTTSAPSRLSAPPGTLLPGSTAKGRASPVTCCGGGGCDVARA